MFYTLLWSKKALYYGLKLREICLFERSEILAILEKLFPIEK